ncbi:MAG: ArnT family glycosyltransferase [Syntrophales bacterium]
MLSSTLAQHAITLLIIVGWCAIAVGTGRLFLGFTRIRSASRGEELFISLALGLASVAYAVFFLSLFRLLSAAPLAFLIILFAVLAVVGFVIKLPRDPQKPALRSRWDRAATPFLGILLVIGLLQTFTPEIGKDALIYHLAVPKLYLANQGLYLIPGNVFASYPLLGEMHYLLALFLQDDILARAMHYAVLGLILLGIGLCSRYLMREHAFPAVSMLVFVSIPSVFLVSSMAYNDLFVTLFTLAALYAFLCWYERGSTGWILLCGIFSGAAAACKYTALLIAPLGCLGILWLMARRRAGPGAALGRCTLYLSAAFLCGSPFYLKNWVLTGNPFYPFLYGLFGGLLWDADQARLYDLLILGLGMGRDWLDYLLLPFNLSFRAQLDSPRFDGILGPIFFLTLPFLLGTRRWERPVGVLLLFTLATFLFWASSAQQIRYLIPQFALLAIVCGAILTRYRDRKPLLALIVLVMAVSLLFNGYHIFRNFQKVRPLAVTIGWESRDSFLERLIPTYPLYRFVNRHLPRESRVFLIYMKNYTFLCEVDCYADAMFETHTLQKILRASPLPAQVGNALRHAGFTHLLYDERYLLGGPSPLTPAEKDLFLAFRERECTPLVQHGPYRLDRLNPAAGHTSGIPPGGHAGRRGPPS